MTHDQFKTWLELLGKAWREKNPTAAMNLCAENVIYYEEPFKEPFHGKQEVYDIWEEVPNFQKDIEFDYEILAVTEAIGVAKWHATFTRLPSMEKAELEGIYSVKLNEDSLCTEFHQWWNSKY